MHTSVTAQKKDRRFWKAALHFFAVTAIIIAVPVLSVLADDEMMLVIDPGHGGLDGGAVSVTGTAESGINLAISQKLLALARLYGMQAILTRDSETLDYPNDTGSIHEKKVWDQKRRADLINGCGSAVLFSVHQNNYPDRRPNGTQVFYGRAEGSEELGKLLHENLVRCLCPDNRRVAAPISEKLYLFKSVHCPSVLIECGFLSNPVDAERLIDPDYQTKLAAVILASWLQYRR